MGLRPGDRFGRYELVSRLGHGGMAETWRARLLAAAGITKPVLIKRILPEYSSDDAFISMFISEARISATLSHGNIAQVHDFGQVDGEYFLAMEYVDGKPLDRIIKRARQSGLASLPTPLATFIALEMCRGLHYAHTRTDDSGKPLGIVHRDISPDNVLVSYEGQVKLVDFGIAKARMQRNFNTAPGVVKGKYLFFSPEQARGEEVDGRTDVWATGVVLYELLCGRLPVEGPEYAALPKLLSGAFPHPSVLRPELPAELEELVMKALALKKEERFESSHAFGDALTGYLYSTTPRFSALSLSHFIQELFREDLIQEGRAVQVPASFHEELAHWRSPPTAPHPQAQAPMTDPSPPVAETQPLPPARDSFGRTRVKFYRRHSRKLWVLISAGLAASVALAVIKLGPDRFIPSRALAWLAHQLQPPTPETSVNAPTTDKPPAGSGPTAPPSSPSPKPEEPQHASTRPSGPVTPPPTMLLPPPKEAPPPRQEPPRVDKRAAWALADDARSLMRAGNYTEASAVLSRCLDIDPNHGDCRRLYANVLGQLGETERAGEQMRQFLRNPPSERPPDLPSTPLPSYQRAPRY